MHRGQQPPYRIPGKRGKLCRMNDQTLLYEPVGNGIAVLTFNRPQVRNALNLETMRAFAVHIARLSAESSLRAVIITGAGQAAFCSGGDLGELSQYPSEADARAFISLMGDALLALERLPVPVIAAINGYALGGGSEIALACDLRFADDTVRMGFVQIKMALTPGWGAGQRLLRVVGYARAMEILLQGRAMKADEVLALGLVNRIVPHGTTLHHALEFAREVASAPPEVVRAIKALLQAGLTQPYDAALTVERDLFPPLWAAEPHLQAVHAFISREPNPDQR